MQNVKSTRKIITITMLVLIILAVIIGFSYDYYSKKIDIKGNYYSQLDSGYCLQLKSGSEFTVAYNPKKDVNNKENSSDNLQAYIESHGTWSKQGDEIVLKFNDRDYEMTFVRTKNGLYNKNTVYKGKLTGEKLFMGIFKYDKTESEKYEVVFFKDQTMIKNSKIGKKQNVDEGTYTRVEDIVTVRYKNNPDFAHKYFVVEGGLSDDIYVK